MTHLVLLHKSRLNFTELTGLIIINFCLWFTPGKPILSQSLKNVNQSKPGNIVVFVLSPQFFEILGQDPPSLHQINDVEKKTYLNE